VKGISKWLQGTPFLEDLLFYASGIAEKVQRKAPP